MVPLCWYSRDIVYPSEPDVSDMDMCIMGPTRSHDTRAHCGQTCLNQRPR